MVYPAARSRSNGLSHRSGCRMEGITMPRATRRPLDERARARLRDAQRIESDAVAAIHIASIKKESVEDKLDAVVAKHQIAINRAEHELNKAQAQLALVSGIERAALLLEKPVAALRAAVRSATGEVCEERS